MIFGYEDEGAPGPRTKMQIVRVPDDTDGNHQSSPCRRHSVTEIALFNLLIYTFWGRNRAAYELSRKFRHVNTILNILFYCSLKLLCLKN